MISNGNKDKGFGGVMTAATPDSAAAEAERKASRAAYAREWRMRHLVRLNAARAVRDREHPELVRRARQLRKERHGARILGLVAKDAPGEHAWAKQLVYRTRSRARRNGVPCAVTWEQLADAWKRQGGKCAWSGVQMTLATHSAWTVSIDRRELPVGYVDGNIILSAWIMNRARGNMSEVEFGRVLSTLGVRSVDRIPIDREVSDN